MKIFALIFFWTIIITPIIGQNPNQRELIQVNGIELYYEVFGEGEPLLLLHGWTQSSQFWKEYIRTYEESFRVYAIDLRGHGKSSPLNSDFSIQEVSLDIKAFINQLQLGKVKAIGLSYGGLALLQLASLEPEQIKSMILIGVSANYDAKENENLKAFTFENLPTAFIEELNATHHHGEEQVKSLFDKNLNYKIELIGEDLKQIRSKTLIVSGDRDEILGIDPAFSLHKKLPNSELWIVPGTGHIAIVGPNQADFLNKSLQFLQSE